ncbi:hypothetical protein DFH27DRAFT_527477 [Peziza echinospora]|nr:hypothetical protein DFH27DRAFT_527477 [Peziza echinospora]
MASTNHPPPPPPPPPSTNLVISISGGTSSGKTTLSRLLQSIFSNLTIPLSAPSSHPHPQITITTTPLHQDDFFLPEPLQPLRTITHNDPTTGVPTTSTLSDWDSHKSINFPALKHALHLFRTSPTPLSRSDVLAAIGVENLEATNCIGPEKVSKEVLEGIRSDISRELSQKISAVNENEKENEEKKDGNEKGNTSLNLIILDGFLLYHDEEDTTSPQHPLLTLLDLRLLLRTNFLTASKRRNDRMTYVSVENFWEDPAGYFDQIVWPNYVHYHSHVFENGDVEKGGLTEWARSEAVIFLQPEDGGGDAQIEEVLRWACGKVVETVAGRLADI